MFRIHPGGFRRCYWLTVILIVVAGGWIWFGNSGLGLLSLWAFCRRPWRCPSFSVDLRERLMTDCVVSPWWLSGRVAGQRHQVFRDELSPGEWRRLRRCVLAARHSR